MRYFRSYKISKRIWLLAAAGLAAAYLLGFAAKVYSPAYIGRLPVPIPIITRAVPTTDSQSPPVQNPWKLLAPVSAITAIPAYFTHTAIITTYFWVGEPGDRDNGNIANKASAWDDQWQSHYGGVDTPSPRSGYYPAAFTPKENPFYFALPYNDIDSGGQRKPTGVNCPDSAEKSNFSWCKNSWIAIRSGGKVAYAQWEDVGPFGEDDESYVFGDSQPKNKRDSKAGLDVSPAVKDYLGLNDVSRTDWVFVRGQDVPAGPWRIKVTTDPGYSL